MHLGSVAFDTRCIDRSFVNAVELLLDDSLAQKYRGMMQTAAELLREYLEAIHDPARAAALFADDGVIELPWVNARAQGPRDIERFLQGLLTRVPDFAFENVRIHIDTPTQAFAEYDARGTVPSTGKAYHQTYMGLLDAADGRIKLLREGLDTLVASRAFGQA